MLKKHTMLIIFCFLSVFLGGCAKINVQIQFKDIPTCQNFCQSAKFLGKEIIQTCKETCQKTNNTEISTQKAVELSQKYFKKAVKEKESKIVQDQETGAECNKICTSLWPTNIQEKNTCTISCLNP